MLAYKGFVHCRDAAGPALWLHAEAQMKGWQSCVLRNYNGELAMCSLDDLLSRIIPVIISMW